VRLLLHLNSGLYALKVVNVTRKPKLATLLSGILFVAVLMRKNLVGRKMMVVMSGVDLSLTGHAAYMKIILLLWAFVRQLELDFAPKTS